MTEIVNRHCANVPEPHYCHIVSFAVTITDYYYQKPYDITKTMSTPFLHDLGHHENVQSDSRVQHGCLTAWLDKAQLQTPCSTMLIMRTAVLGMQREQEFLASLKA